MRQRSIHVTVQIKMIEELVSSALLFELQTVIAIVNIMLK